MESQRGYYYREVAESLLASNNSMLTHPMLSHSSVNLIASEEAAGGWRQGGRMSSVRRFFCLFCTFDLLFTALLWLISVMLTGESIVDLWNREVLQYHIGSSLLDVVGVAAIRFLLLLLAYAAIHMDHWAVVALTTSGTCAFLIAKVFIFDWTKAPQPVFQVLLILLSFSLCWGEAWFLDCKVLPQEALCASMNNPQPVSIPNMRTGHLGPSDITSIADFYSPVGSPEPSPPSNRRVFLTTPSQDEQYQKMALESEMESLQLLEGPEWTKEKTGINPGDLVEAMKHPRYGKIFKLTGIVDCAPEDLFKGLTDLENINTWNPTILESKIVKQIDEETSITYQITTGGPKNAVKPRDFVCVRRIAKTPTHMITSSVSIEHPQCPPIAQYTRGHNHIGCWMVKPYEEDGVTKALFQWVMACDLKGWIPQYVLDIAFSTAQLDFLQHLRNYAVKIKNNATV